jgi:gamma-aminobutyric acid type B receptor
MVCVDLLILMIWTLKDPLRKETFQLASEPGENDEIIYDPEIEICKCNHQMIWVGVVFGIKGIILILGLYLSYETRNSKIDRMNDSKFVALSIYNIVVRSAFLV